MREVDVLLKKVLNARDRVMVNRMQEKRFAIDLE
jgi:hypothetical protein